MFRKSLFKDLTFTDIHTLYSVPREAERFFFDRKWKDGFVCSKCGHTHCTTVIRKDGSLRTVYQCSHCGHQESVTAGTALEGTKAPLLSWILVMFVFVMSKTGTSAKYISDLTGVSYHTTNTAGTALEGTKAPLLSWILVMFVFVMSKTGTSAKYISDLTGVSYHTTKLILRKIGQAQKQDNETHAATDCDAIGLDVFSYGGKKHGKRAGEQQAKAM